MSVEYFQLRCTYPDRNYTGVPIFVLNLKVENNVLKSVLLDGDANKTELLATTTYVFKWGRKTGTPDNLFYGSPSAESVVTWMGTWFKCPPSGKFPVDIDGLDPFAFWSFWYDSRGNYQVAFYPSDYADTHIYPPGHTFFSVTFVLEPVLGPSPIPYCFGPSTFIKSVVDGLEQDVEVGKIRPGDVVVTKRGERRVIFTKSGLGSADFCYDGSSRKLFVTGPHAVALTGQDAIPNSEDAESTGICQGIAVVEACKDSRAQRVEVEREIIYHFAVEGDEPRALVLANGIWAETLHKALAEM
jgi:hypothetical protein